MPGSRPTGMRTILGLLLAATLLSGCGGGPSGGDTQITVEPRLPGPTRTESYRGVEITVPASWGWAAAPVDQGGDLATCADPGAWPPSGEPAEGIPYVGRPTWTRAVCQAWQESEPDAPYAWLGVPLESGRRTYGDWTVETKVLHGVPVTVASKQEMQRLAILDSARVADIDSNGCPQGPGTTRPGSREGTGKPAHLSVCVYKATGRGPVELFASARVGATRAQRFLDAVSLARPSAQPCPRPREPQPGVLLVAETDDPYGTPGATQHPQWWVDPSCGLRLSAEVSTAITRDLVAPWAVPIVRAFVTSTAARGDAAAYFAPMMG